MISGLLTFEQHFRMVREQYVIIGGTACDLLIHEQGGDFRATKDLDMVLIVETMTSNFGETFWAFIRGMRRGADRIKHRNTIVL